MSVHCLESGCIGKYTPLGPRDFPCAGILHPSALEIALGLRPRAISRASGCKIPALGKSLGPRGVYFPIHPSSRQCTNPMYITHTTLVPYSTANGDVYTLGEVIVTRVGISVSFQSNSINQVFKSEIIIILLMMIFFGNIDDHRYSLQCRNVFLHIHL